VGGRREEANCRDEFWLPAAGFADSAATPIVGLAFVHVTPAIRVFARLDVDCYANRSIACPDHQAATRKNLQKKNHA
jgi:hypothetical protein